MLHHAYFFDNFLQICINWNLFNCNNLSCLFVHCFKYRAIRPVKKKAIDKKEYSVYWDVYRLTQNLARTTLSMYNIRNRTSHTKVEERGGWFPFGLTLKPITAQTVNLGHWEEDCPITTFSENKRFSIFFCKQTNNMPKLEGCFLRGPVSSKVLSSQWLHSWILEFYYHLGTAFLIGHAAWEICFKQSEALLRYG